MTSSSKKRKTAAGSTPAVRRGGDSSSNPGASIEYLDSFKKLQKSWPKDMKRLLDPSLPDERRSELWELMCEGGDVLRQRCVIYTGMKACNGSTALPRTLHVIYDTRALLFWNDWHPLKSFVETLESPEIYGPCQSELPGTTLFHNETERRRCGLCGPASGVGKRLGQS